MKSPAARLYRPDTTPPAMASGPRTRRMKAAMVAMIEIVLSTAPTPLVLGGPLLA